MKVFILTFLVFFSPPALAKFDYGTASDVGLALNVGASVFTMPTWEKRGLVAAGHALNFGLNYGLKHLFASPCRSFSERPDGTDCLGMPSGHSQSSMFGAGVICQEFGGTACGAGVAVGLGTMYGRVMDNRHTIKQVFVGGTMGFAGGFYGITVSAAW